MVCATYNCFQIPLEIAFNPPVLQTSGLKTLAVLIDLIFVLDIILAFRTTFINANNGLEIRNINEIARYYLQGQFTIDLLATLPFDTFAEIIMGDAGYFKVLGSLKLVRVMRLNRIITYLRTSMEIKAMLMVFKLIFYLVMYVHCYSCVWWLLVRDS